MPVFSSSILSTVSIPIFLEMCFRLMLCGERSDTFVNLVCSVDVNHDHVRLINPIKFHKLSILVLIFEISKNTSIIQLLGKSIHNLNY